MKKLLPVLAALLVAFTLACGAGEAGPGAVGPHSVVLEVSGPPTAMSVGYGIGADQSQEGNVALPWRKELTVSGMFLAVSLVAQSGEDGVISCQITIDGKVAKRNSSSGRYTIVTCSGS